MDKQQIAQREIATTLYFLIRGANKYFKDKKGVDFYFPPTVLTGCDGFVYECYDYAEALETIYNEHPRECPGIYQYEFVEAIAGPCLAKFVIADLGIPNVDVWRDIMRKEFNKWYLQ